MIKMFLLLLLAYNLSAEKRRLRWAKDAGRAPVFGEEDDGSVTAVWPIFKGPYRKLSQFDVDYNN